MGQSWFKLKVEYPRVRAETREAPEGKVPNDGREPCVTAPAGERGDAQMRQYDPRGSVGGNGRTRPAGPTYVPP